MAILLLFLAIPALYFVHLVYAHFTSPLKDIPGPYLAKFSNLWRLFDTLGGRTELSHILLHNKYGPVVRLGPNLISINDPQVLRKIYDPRGNFIKSDFYKVSDVKVGRQIFPNIFSVRNNDIHTEIRSAMGPFYKLSALLKYEPLMDESIKYFHKRLETEFINPPTGNKNKAVPIDRWILYLSWDFMSNITFSRSMGFLDTMWDHSGWLGMADGSMDYMSVIGQIPFLDWFIMKNPLLSLGPRNIDNIAGWAHSELVTRQNTKEKEAKETNDMLDDFLSLKQKYGPAMHDGKLVNILMANILAGADTTAIVLRSIIYYVLKNPHVYELLQEAIDNAAENTDEAVSFSVARKIQYVDAVILEARRMHPSVGLLLERIVPDSGLELNNGTFLPAGTIVGMNAFVTHKDKSIFGQDADIFNPSRWYRNKWETEEEFQTRLTQMKQNDLTFGAGKRVCLGKDLSNLETYKVVASLFLKFDMELVDPNKEWEIQNSWFMRQSGIDIKIRRREKKFKDIRRESNDSE